MTVRAPGAPPSRYVAVVGPGEGATDDDCGAAETTGRLLAQRGVVVITGGLGGVMGSAAEGASSVGGLSVGVLPQADRDEASPHLTVSIPTGLGEMRNALIVRAADGVVAIGGSWGTLSEIALARRTGVPVVVLGDWTLRGPGGLRPVEHESSPEAAVDRLLRLLAPGGD
jgi:uncharacterized protein (TIGR00725 family)